MGHTREGDRTCHLAIDPSAVEANTAITFLRCRLHKFFDVIHLTASSKSMHDEKNRRILSFLLRFQPVKRNMAAIIEKDLLSLEGEWKKWLADVVDRLKKRMNQVGSGLIEYLFSLLWTL